jgi:transposase InsO family protein
MLENFIPLVAISGEDNEIVIERALATLPADGPRPRLITDNGSQYVSAQFTHYLRASGLSHSRIRVGHPQSNGKYERWNQTAKVECVRRMALGGGAILPRSARRRR